MTFFSDAEKHQIKSQSTSGSKLKQLAKTKFLARSQKEFSKSPLPSFLSQLDPDKTLKQTVITVGLICAVQATVFGSQFASSQIENMSLRADLTSVQFETESEAIPDSDQSLSKTILTLQERNRAWFQILDEIERTAQVKFTQIEGHDSTLDLFGSVVNETHFSLTSLAKLTANLEQLPFIESILIKNSDKKEIADGTFESNFHLEVVIDWPALDEKLTSENPIDVISTNPQLPAISNLIATGEVTDTKSLISLKWDQVDSAALFFIFGGVDESDFSFLGSSMTPDFIFTADQARATYTFQIFPIDAKGRFGLNPGIISAQAGNKIAPAAISNLTQKHIIKKSEPDLVQTKIEWTPSSDPDFKQFLIFAGSSQSEMDLIGKTTETNFSLTQSLIDLHTVWAVITEDTSGNRSKPVFTISQ